MQLVSAITSERSQNIACKTGREYPNHHRFIFFPFAFDQRKVFVGSIFFLECYEFKMAVLGWHIHTYNLFNQGISFQPVFNKVAYGYQFEIKSFGDLFQFGKPCHTPVLVHNFDEYAGRFESSESGQINGRFCMTRSPQHTPLFCTKGENMSWPSEVSWF